MATEIKMDRAKSDTGPQLPNSSKGTTDFIELNVDMNVTVSNGRKSKIFQRSRGVVLFLLAIVFAIELSQLRKEVRALQVQIQSVNVNFVLLMSKYDRLHRSLNRAFTQRSNPLPRSKNKHEMKRFLVGSTSLPRAIEILDNMRNATNKSDYYDSRISYLNSMRHLEEKYLASFVSDSEEPRKAKQELGYLDDANDSSLRIERAILTIEKQNVTESGDTFIKRDAVSHYDSDDDYDDDNDSNTWREPRSGRSRRDEGRGKKRGKNKRRPKRSRRRLGPLVATFVGAIPEQHVTDAVYIGPWVKSRKNNTQYSLNKFHLVEDKKSIEVTATGLYMISAQIFYFGEPTNYSYWILLSSEGKSSTQKLVKCSTASSTSATEVSCYTSIITPLQRGDRVHIQQQERDRLINMREGHSYIQLVLLSNKRRQKFN